MTLEEIKLRRLAGQHLLSPSSAHTVVKDLCGLQAQFLNHALHGLSIRSTNANADGLVKSWTIRGTMHLFAAEDLPLFLHKGRPHFLRPVDTLGPDPFIGSARKEYFARLIVDSIALGIDERDALKAVCTKAGMTESESRSLFDPWGGIIRALCEAGQLCHKVQEKKAYQLCPDFEPMEKEPAQLELARRYFTHFGPATAKDAAYFFGTTQAAVKSWLKQLPVSENVLNGKSYFYIGSGSVAGELPKCLFLAGFDQLMLGYEKTESLFLPKEHLRDIFTLAGIVRPTILADGEVVGWWSRKNRKLTVTLFENANPRSIEETANRLWQDLQNTEFRKV